MKIVSIYLFIILLLNGCVSDAPRDNPLDPQSPGFAKKGNVTGRILIANVSVGIENATVTSATENVSVQTDGLGYFSFPSLSSGKQTFICTKENFTADTFSVTIQTGQTVEVFRNLNGAPVTTFKQILTRKIDRYFPGPEYFVEVFALVSDPNDITDLVVDSVWFVVADTIRYSLTYFGPSKPFAATIYKIDFPTNTIQWLIGKPLTIVSKDKYNAMNISDPFTVTRVIEQSAAPIVSNVDSLSTSFELKWTPPDVTYNYTYTVTVSEIIRGTLKTYTGISSVNESLVYPYTANDAPLEKGNYVWSVTIVDDFGNYSRSKESTFTVK
jgi:hypothetical protein